ncbi:TetR/AcrR family transcriptional regulator [Flindersiella endophytica]
MRADARRNYERLLAEARSTFTEQGADASLEEIARRAGVGIGTLYRHFPTREALLDALLRDRFDGLCELAQKLLATDPPDQAMLTWLHALVENANTYRGLTGQLVSTLNDPESELYASCHAMREAATQLFERAKQAGLVRAEVRGPDVFLLAHAVAWAAEQVPGDTGATDRLLELMWAALRA